MPRCGPLAAGLIILCSSTAGLLAISVQGATAACGKECYVALAPVGKETNDGTESKPWPTISYALKHIAPGSAGKPSKIIVRGEYLEGAISINKKYITLEGEIDAETGARLATIDGSQPLGGWTEVVLQNGEHTNVYKIDGCNDDKLHIREVLVKNSKALSKNRIETRPALQRKRVIRLNDVWKGQIPPQNALPDAMVDFDENSSHIMRRTDKALWEGVEALWGCKGNFLYLRFIEGFPNMHDIRGGSGPIVHITAPGFTVKNFNIYGGLTGVHVSNASPIVDVIIENNLISGGANQIRLEPGAEGTVIRGNELTANLLGNKRGCTPGIDAECWTPGAWVYNPNWPGGIPEYISVRKRVHEATRDKGYQVLSAIAVNGAGPGTIIEGNELHDGIGGIDIGKSDTAVPIQIRYNTIRDMTHFGIAMRPSAHARVHDNTLSNITEPLRPHGLNDKNEKAPREIFVYRNISYLPPYAGEHIFFHWGGSSNPAQPAHKVHFYHNTFLGGYLALVINGLFDPKVGLGNSQFINNVFSTDRFPTGFC